MKRPPYHGISGRFQGRIQPVERLFRNTDLPDHIGHRHAQLGVSVS